MIEIAARDLALELSACPKGALSFDGDGTLWSGDVGEDFFYGILDSGKLSDVAADAIARAASEAGVEVSPDAARTARNIYDAYLSGRFDEERVCEIMTWINAGWTTTETTAFVVSVVSEEIRRAHPPGGAHRHRRSPPIGSRDLRRERVTTPHRRSGGGHRGRPRDARPRGYGRARGRSLRRARSPADPVRGGKSLGSAHAARSQLRSSPRSATTPSTPRCSR